MSSPASGIVSSPIIYGKVDYGPTFGHVYRPLNPKRVFRVPGNDTIQPFDVYVFYAKTIAEAFSVQLPDCALWMSQPYGGFDIVCKDSGGISGDFPITFLAFEDQTINFQTPGDLAPSGGGWQLTSPYGSIIFSPLVDGSGWVTL